MQAALDDGLEETASLVTMDVDIDDKVPHRKSHQQWVYRRDNLLSYLFPPPVELCRCDV